MKKVLLLFAMAATGLAGFYYATGRLPWVAVSLEEQQIAELRGEFHLVRQQWKQAGRAGSFGLDTGTITEVPLAKLERLEGALAGLLPKLRTNAARGQGELLRWDIAMFKSEMR